MYYRKQETDAAYKAQVNQAGKDACAERLKVVGKKAAAIRRAKKSSA